MRVVTGRKYETRDGRKVRILCTDAAGSRCPVIGLITYSNGECVGYWNLDGTNNSMFDLDLLAPTEQEKITRLAEIVAELSAMEPPVEIITRGGAYMPPLAPDKESEK